MPKRKETEWIKVVKHTFKAGKQKNKSYKFSQALKDAKKVYKSGK
jgi:hypothetical protein